MQKDTILTLIDNLKDEKSLGLVDKLNKIKHLQTHVLLIGETGVGKDFWARYLAEITHKQNFVNLNCGDVPENLLESEWFGFKRGAFTGADRDYDGKWSQAADGILFLNQIDLLSLNLQARLLRIIERKKYFPLGSNQEKNIKARFIFSTDADIEDRVREGTFRQDLFYRISAYKIFIPPLRERKKDILPLIFYFAGKKSMKIKIDKESKDLLVNYPWKGNIREIENFINQASIGAGEINDRSVNTLFKNSEDVFETLKGDDISLQDLEKRYIRYLMRKYGNKKKVTAILKISRKSLYNKLNKYEKD